MSSFVPGGSRSCSSTSSPRSTTTGRRASRPFATPRYEIVATGQVHEGRDAVIAYHQAQRTAFPDQRHEHVRMHVADDDTVISEFDLLGTNTGDFLGLPPTGKAFRVPVIAVFTFDGDGITNERVYLDGASLLRQIGREELLPLAGSEHFAAADMH